MQRFLSTLLVTTLVSHFVSSPLLANQLAEEKFSADSIEQVIDAKLMSNYPDGNFHADRPVTRAQLASILVKAFKLERLANTMPNPAPVPNLKDVPNSYWAAKDIQTVIRTKVMTGYRPGEFFPEEKVNRAEGFAIFANAYIPFDFADSTIAEILRQYPDADKIPTWARKAIVTALQQKFINVSNLGYLNPLAPMTRGDLAHALSQYLAQQSQPQYPALKS